MCVVNKGCENMNLMIDIETLGIKRDAPVMSIGACFFDKTGIKSEFYISLDVAGQIDSGLRKVDAQTIKWWMSQEDASKKVFRETAVETSKALAKFHAWVLGGVAGGESIANTGTKPWGNGSNFDIEILESIFKDYGFSIPWNFRNIRDFRTFKEHVYDGHNTKRIGTHHNALDDAMYQAQVVIDGLNRNEPKPLSVKNSFAVFLADIKGKLRR